MEVWKAALLGIVQGLTEFLPVSSSGHLLLFEWLLGVDTGGADMFLGIMLHMGTLAAVLFLYAPKLWAFLKSDRKKLLYLLLGTIPAGLTGVFLGDLVDKLFFGGEWLWAGFLATALLLLYCDAKAKRARVFRPLTAKSALEVGAAQALAVIPGLSRSGTTLSAGIAVGLDKETAADFSFLLSIPVIAGAVCVELWKSFQNPAYVSAISWQSLAVGTICAAVFGFISIQWMLKIVKGKKLFWFSVYLFLLAAVLMILQFFL